ncbi:hypothetical protein MEQU1_003033 [Malassezia equina]|uniref:Uncharacterized protein n=1 Tax=Malassezia equina TaxID=1381935 RepID=A0AAF0EFA6_9BASI|nr:hypothetical protein MEQU1_003033 [Malassezia equina]
MPTKPMSSRLQGLKFMQRGAQRAALQAEKEGSDEKSTKTAEAAPTPADPDQWVVPHSRPVASPKAEDNWDEWLLGATNEESMNTRRTYGDWKSTRRTLKQEKRLDDDFNEAHALLDESDDEEEEDSSSADDDSASDSEEAFLSAHSSPQPTFQKPPSAASRRKPPAPPAPAPKRMKQAAVADKSQSLRKKKQR